MRKQCREKDARRGQLGTRVLKQVLPNLAGKFSHQGTRVPGLCLGQVRRRVGGCSRAGQGQGQALKRGHSPEGTSSLVAFGWLRQLPASPAMILPLPWLSRCCCRGLLPFWPPVLQGTWRCCSQGSKANREDASSDGLGKMSPSRVSGTKSEGVAQGAQIHMRGGGGGGPPPCTGQLKAGEPYLWRSVQPPPSMLPLPPCPHPTPLQAPSTCTPPSLHSPRSP